MLYATSWITFTGTAWRKKVFFLFVSYTSMSAQLFTGLVSRARISGMDPIDTGSNAIISNMLLFLYTLLLLWSSRVNENHMRKQFYQSWTLLQTKIQQEQMLQKQKFNEQEIEVIRQVMENRNEDIDMELQEVVIDSDDVKLEGMLGKGAYGEVFKANYEGIHVAVKVIKDISEKALERTRAEILLMKGLQHPQIVMFIGACWDEFMMGIVLELVDNGPLANFLHNKKLHLSWEHPKVRTCESQITSQ